MKNGFLSFQGEFVVKEFSAGGLVFDKGMVLLVFMNTISNTKVWTFPKGHIEENESPKEAALREVLEETGYRCSIIDEKEFFINNYNFTRNGKRVSKTVYWYLMKPIENTGKVITPLEIEEVRWFDIVKAKEILFYPSDKKMIDLLVERIREV